MNEKKVKIQPNVMPLVAMVNDARIKFELDQEQLREVMRRWETELKRVGGSVAEMQGAMRRAVGGVVGLRESMIEAGAGWGEHRLTRAQDGERAWTCGRCGATSVDPVVIVEIGCAGESGEREVGR